MGKYITPLSNFKLQLPSSIPKIQPQNLLNPIKSFSNVPSPKKTSPLSQPIDFQDRDTADVLQELLSKELNLEAQPEKIDTPTDDYIRDTIIAREALDRRPSAETDDNDLNQTPHHAIPVLNNTMDYDFNQETVESESFYYGQSQSPEQFNYQPEMYYDPVIHGTPQNFVKIHQEYSSKNTPQPSEIFGKRSPQETSFHYRSPSLRSVSRLKEHEYALKQQSSPKTSQKSTPKSERSKKFSLPNAVYRDDDFLQQSIKNRRASSAVSSSAADKSMFRPSSVNESPQKNSLLSDFDRQSDRETTHGRAVQETIPESLEEELDNKADETNDKSNEKEEIPIQDSGQLNIGISYHPLKQSLEIFIS